MDAPSRGERAASTGIPAPCSPASTAASSWLLFITFPSTTKHFLHCLSAPSPGSWSEAGHFSWLGNGRKRAPCTLPVSQHTPGEARDALSYYTGDPPLTPDPTACPHFKLPLCHFIFQTSCRLEELFSSRLIPQTVRRELLSSGSSRPLWDYVELCLAAPLFGCGRFKTSNTDGCKTSCSYVFKSDRGPVKRNELNLIPSWQSGPAAHPHPSGGRDIPPALPQSHRR